jgi:proteasome lid subunit RPN8/RPN11
MLDEQVAVFALAPAARAAMLRAARRSPRQEACGALLGVLAPDQSPRVLAAWPLSNRASATERAYLITAEQVRATEEKAQARGLDVIGFFHSHPQGGFTPSTTDLQQAWPGYVYAIVDGVSRDIAFWMLAEDRQTFRPLAAHA